jgi:glycosyltransferase involved in cell wall biosynthesis
VTIAPPTSGRASVVIPAHNEQAGIQRLLDGLLADAEPDEFEVLVVCNGCTDKTAEVARSYGPSVRVVELEQAGKSGALRAGDELVHSYPRLYVDADIELRTTDMRELIGALAAPDILAAGPSRVLPMTGVSAAVRRYYAVWENLPQVKEGLFGRGVIAFTSAGHDRVVALPPLMSDDLAISEAFAPGERMIVTTARVVVHPPRNLRDLLRRRIRVNTGNAQLDDAVGRSSEARTSIQVLAGLARTGPGMAVNVVVFASVAVLSKLAARRRIRSGDYTTWSRDQSSRETAV